MVSILVQSAIGPNWEYAFHNAGHLLAAPPEVRPFEPCIAVGESHRFRLLANPTRKIGTKTGPDGKKNNGQRVPVSSAKLGDWLNQHAEKAGFSILSVSDREFGPSGWPRHIILTTPGSASGPPASPLGASRPRRSLRICRASGHRGNSNWPTHIQCRKLALPIAT